jgi:hypothetical protein
MVATAFLAVIARVILYENPLLIMPTVILFDAWLRAQCAAGSKPPAQFTAWLYESRGLWEEPPDIRS